MKNLLFSFIAIFFMLSFNSCVHDSCLDLNCRQGASCIDDHCQCPPGYEGTECETLSKARFLGMWVGTSKCEGFPQSKDTVEFMTYCNPNRLIIKAGIGNLSTNTFLGTAGAPEMTFEVYEDDYVTIEPYVRVDANYMQLTFRSKSKMTNLRYVCEFEGRRVAGTAEDPGYNGPKGEDCN